MERENCVSNRIGRAAPRTKEKGDTRNRYRPFDPIHCSLLLYFLLPMTPTAMNNAGNRRIRR